MQSSETPMVPGTPKKTVATDQDIYDRIFAAILDRKLQPGAHLREVELAEMFGVSRTKVRQALAKLIQAGVVELRPNRGAAVAAPTRAQARHLFDLRAMIEPVIARQCAQMRTPAQVERLRAHVAYEDRARTGQDEATLIRATGEFHLLLAELLGNPLLDRLLRDLEALTCLSILSYARTESCACLPDEHRGILEAIATGDAEQAKVLMASHLENVRREMDLREPAKAAPSLSQALGLLGKGVGPRGGRGRRGVAKAAVSS